ncbi:poly(A) polymerase [Rhizobium sp. RU20A]|uniref:CCA tRNA nucleotidyltransferase n=1 Tax=Rhizobium sp. RU20A TaxID=1907412 RepID=UPI000955F482|nr:CCA tRNA nucleotidyltransferase [Rhizobium sp. RU20A]SIQ26876.1 poly(A) polymerase [Rhizobium sp. RU20A]
MTADTAPSVAREAWFRDAALTRILSLLNGDGGETRVVGGAVRNSLMGVPVADVDLATTLVPQAVSERAAADGIKVVPTGIAHGTVTLVLNGRGFEVTTLRRDVATDGRHAEVAFGTDWQVDAERRDLTMNALYADREGRVIDLVGGLADIASRTVRFIGDAHQRVAEDYLRVLRFFRFFAQYGSSRPDAEGLRAAARAKDELSRLSAERIWAEMKKLLGARDPGRALLWMRTSGVLTVILPETEKWGIDAIPGLIAAEAAYGWAPDAMLRLMAIVPPDAERLAGLAERLRLSRAEAGRLQAFAAAPMVKPDMAGTALDRLLYRKGREGIVDRLKLALAVARAKAEVETEKMAETARLLEHLRRAERWSKPQFPLSGADLLKTGVAAGPAVGRALGELERIWVDGNFHLDRAALLARLPAVVEAGDKG